MSRHYHIHANDVAHIVNEIHHLTPEKVQELYGIEYKKDGTVFDPTYDRLFETLGEWANFCKEQDEMEFSEEFGHGKQTHEDFH